MLEIGQLLVPGAILLGALVTGAIALVSTSRRSGRIEGALLAMQQTLEKHDAADRALSEKVSKIEIAMARIEEQLASIRRAV